MERRVAARRYRAISRIIVGIYAQERVPESRLLKMWRTLRAQLCADYAMHRTRRN